MISPCRATVVTFDDLPVNTDTTSFIPGNYQGLIWSNLAVENAILSTNILGVTGYHYGMVSASNVTFNAFGNPVEIDSTGTNFNFLSTYLTGAWRSNLSIEVQGFSGATMLYGTTVVASATAPTLFAFNYLNIDRLTIDPFGGQYAGFGGYGNEFVMDNFTFEFVPEPSTMLLAALGALTLWPLLKRRRA